MWTTDWKLAIGKNALFVARVKLDFTQVCSSGDDMGLHRKQLSLAAVLTMTTKKTTNLQKKTCKITKVATVFTVLFVSMSKLQVANLLFTYCICHKYKKKTT